MGVEIANAVSGFDFGQVLSTVQSIVGQLLSGLTPAEIAAVMTLAGLAIAFLRFNWLIHTFLKLAAFLFVISVIAILFGIVNF